MSEMERKTRWLQSISALSVIALFIADIGFDALAKPVPEWGYWVPGLLALGV